MSSLISISISLEIVDSPKVEMEMEKLDDIWGKNCFFYRCCLFNNETFFLFPVNNHLTRQVGWINLVN